MNPLDPRNYATVDGFIIECFDRRIQHTDDTRGTWLYDVSEFAEISGLPIELVDFAARAGLWSKVVKCPDGRIYISEMMLPTGIKNRRELLAYVNFVNGCSTADRRLSEDDINKWIENAPSVIGALERCVFTSEELRSLVGEFITYRRLIYSEGASKL